MFIKLEAMYFSNISCLAQHLGLKTGSLSNDIIEYEDMSDRVTEACERLHIILHMLVGVSVPQHHPPMHNCTVVLVL